MAVQFTKIRNKQGKIIAVKVITENKYGEELHLVFSRIWTESKQGIRRKTIAITERTLPYRSRVEREDEFKINSKYKKYIKRKVENMLLGRNSKQNKTGRNPKTKNSYTCPYCGYIDPVLRQYIEDEIIPEEWTCPNCGNRFRVSGAGNRPMYWQRRKTKKRR